jgi:hypothetical protein
MERLQQRRSNRSAGAGAHDGNELLVDNEGK